MGRLSGRVYTEKQRLIRLQTRDLRPNHFATNVGDFKGMAPGPSARERSPRHAQPHSLCGRLQVLAPGFQEAWASTQAGSASNMAIPSVPVHPSISSFPVCLPPTLRSCSSFPLPLISILALPPPPPHPPRPALVGFLFIPFHFLLTLRLSVHLSACSLPPLHNPPSLSLNPSALPLSSGPSLRDEKGACQFAGTDQANPIPPEQGEEGRPEPPPGHTSPSHREEPRASRPYRAMQAKPGSGATGRPGNSLHLSL